MPYTPAQPRPDAGRLAPATDLRAHGRQANGMEASVPRHGDQARPSEAEPREQGKRKRLPVDGGREREMQKRRPNSDIREQGHQWKRPNAKSDEPRRQNRLAAPDSRDRERKERVKDLQDHAEWDEALLPQSERTLQDDPLIAAENGVREQKSQAVDGSRIGERHADKNTELSKSPLHRDGDAASNSSASERDSPIPGVPHRGSLGTLKAAADARRLRARFLQRSSAKNFGLPNADRRKPVPVKGSIALSAPAVRQLLARLAAGPAGLDFSVVRQMTLSTPGFVHAQVRRQPRGANPSQDRTSAVPSRASTGQPGKPASIETGQRRDVQPAPSDDRQSTGFLQARGQSRRSESAPVHHHEPERQETADQPYVGQSDLHRSFAKKNGSIEENAREASKAGDVGNRAEADRDSNSDFAAGDRRVKSAGGRAVERHVETGRHLQDDDFEQKLPESQGPPAVKRGDLPAWKADDHLRDGRYVHGSGRHESDRRHELFPGNRESGEPWIDGGESSKASFPLAAQPGSEQSQASDSMRENNLPDMRMAPVSNESLYHETRIQAPPFLAALSTIVVRESD
ncbi:hypothetical protein OMP38_00605 [Cohnella ginsengisoli]|uniref:Uncharacterized protein n=1 Tax=Cohnella ginsengisoli TaxID=425004 RepID=A0A9X4KCV7_9BACL|nr:hypothetical protein [Cohnella ginsengisoli]MDG0789520.1 hypothetical protein [Cohnella ginsengisoli]